jgi:nucleotide-binding universal stress UspA family protein
MYVNVVAGPAGVICTRAQEETAMGFKNLLVQIDGGKAAARRIDAAIGLAHGFDAHLTGLMVVGEPQIPGFVMAQMPAGAWDQTLRQLRLQAEAVADGFIAAAERAGLTADCRIDSALETEVARIVALHARHADLAILGQADPDDPQPGGAGLIGDVVLSAGRPVLAIPYIGAGPTLGERVLVAWDGGREAARALNDALPFLKRAKTVSVVAINASRRPYGHGSQAGADIALHLARHGVKVQAEALEIPDVSVGDALLSRLADAAADLLVMGAYGRSRFSETILGGATRTILGAMTVPVFMSH